MGPQSSSGPDPDRFDLDGHIDLVDGRIWMLWFESPQHVENVPRLVIEQYPNQEALDRLEPDGRVWYRPEDLSTIVEELRSWLGAYVRTAREAAEGPLPRPNWGDLQRPDP